MTTGLKAIETVYRGYRFRSRLEARWAVFFDALGIRYEYEKEGFDLGDGIQYLPDFWLPDFHCWVEIKGSDISKADVQKVQRLAEQSKSRAFVFIGNIGVPEARKVGQTITFLSGSVATMFGGPLDRWLGERCLGWMWVACPSCGVLGIVGCRDDGRGTEGLQACHCTLKTLKPTADKLRAAYEAARSARFEHGETGRRW